MQLTTLREPVLIFKGLHPLSEEKTIGILIINVTKFQKYCFLVELNNLLWFTIRISFD